MSTKTETDIILIGGGIMSATLGVLLKELEPNFGIRILEKLDKIAEESSDGWNNAGTGHSAFCELNYTPQLPDGSIDISKAVKIAEAYEASREFWSYLVEKKYVSTPRTFIYPIPHMSCVWGEKDISFLKQRHSTLTRHPLFREMLYSEDPGRLRQWMPLMWEDRTGGDRMAATFMPEGTDVNFGALTRALMEQLSRKQGVHLSCNNEVIHLCRRKQKWEVTVKDTVTGKKEKIVAPFVFIGAGGGALLLLEKSGIPESNGYAGFPVSGQWLICNNEAVIGKHHAKVYGKAAVGAPPMSMPHLDSRMIGGKRNLLFGPYAGFTTKFLKHGSVWDLLRSIRLNNVIPMIAAGYHNIRLTKYLVKQVTQSSADRMEALKVFVPSAQREDWFLQDAGQRVQVIKKDKRQGGVLEFGTELVISSDGTLAALLGASPGASVAASIMLELLRKSFPAKMKTTAWQNKLMEMIPSSGMSLNVRTGNYAASRERTDKVLKVGRYASAQ